MSLKNASMIQLVPAETFIGHSSTFLCLLGVFVAMQMRCEDVSSRTFQKVVILILIIIKQVKKKNIKTN